MAVSLSAFSHGPQISVVESPPKRISHTDGRFIELVAQTVSWNAYKTFMDKMMTLAAHDAVAPALSVIYVFAYPGPHHRTGFFTLEIAQVRPFDGFVVDTVGRVYRWNRSKSIFQLITPNITYQECFTREDYARLEFVSLSSHTGQKTRADS